MPLLLRKKPQKILAQNPAYQILFCFKQDSSKQVFKALRKDEETGLEQEVLLKIFLDEKSACREEFESLSQVFSPYCVRVLGFESFGDKKALVLEYIKGVSLFDLVNQFSLSSKEIHYILKFVYKGLKDLNRQGFCHGDLSLNNILIDEQARIKLIDFGKANYHKDTQGTLPFVAPEVLKGIRANFLSDLYSLGVVEAVLKTPYPLSSLKDKKREDFDISSPLLSADPSQRYFPYKENSSFSHKNHSSDKNSLSFQPEEVRTLSYKVKDILALREFRQGKTIKIPSSPSFFRTPLRNFFCFMVVLFSVSLTPLQMKSSQGLVKIYTNKWFKIRMGSFESYTPVVIPLKKGWWLVHWEHKESQGTIKVFVSKGSQIFLRDEDFLKEEKNLLKNLSAKN